VLGKGVHAKMIFLCRRYFIFNYCHVLADLDRLHFTAFTRLATSRLVRWRRAIPERAMENVFYSLNLILRKFNLLLQGPPGTGKSFLGVKILRLMLSMKINERFKGPILVGK
jgi:hypothetical protein